MIHFSDEETTVEVRTLPKPDPSVIVQVEAKRGNSGKSSLKLSKAKEIKSKILLKLNISTSRLN